MITFKECQSSGYRARTMINASADITIAIAKDFTTAGERLTKTCTELQHKTYIHISYDNMNNYVLYRGVSNIITNLKPQSINIAGNGIYTLNTLQSEVDEKVYIFLREVFHHAIHKPRLIRSGGQTGIDEAGLKAAVKLGIPALCLAPKGWTFRDINSKDISNEEQFKARFK